MNHAAEWPRAPRTSVAGARAAFVFAMWSAFVPLLGACSREPAQRTGLRALCEAYRNAPRTPRPAARFAYALARLSPADRGTLSPALQGATLRERADGLRRLARLQHLETECFGMIDALDADEDAPDAPDARDAR